MFCCLLNLQQGMLFFLLEKNSVLQLNYYYERKLFYSRTAGCHLIYNDFCRLYMRETRLFF